MHEHEHTSLEQSGWIMGHRDRVPRRLLPPTVAGLSLPDPFPSRLAFGRAVLCDITSK